MKKLFVITALLITITTKIIAPLNSGNTYTFTDEITVGINSDDHEEIFKK